jgi:hypothetical protein
LGRQKERGEERNLYFSREGNGGCRAADRQAEAEKTRLDRRDSSSSAADRGDEEVKLQGGTSDAPGSENASVTD